jgi:hypothetical protein
MKKCEYTGHTLPIAPKTAGWTGAKNRADYHNSNVKNKAHVTQVICSWYFCLFFHHKKIYNKTTISIKIRMIAVFLIMNGKYVSEKINNGTNKIIPLNNSIALQSHRSKEIKLLFILVIV